MTVTLTPAPLRGTVAAVPSKSEAQRMLICAALADAPTRILHPGCSEDIEATLRCLGALGAGITAEGDALIVSPGTPPPETTLDCGESGATLRFMLPVAAALCGRIRAVGRGRLPRRPVGALVAALEANGVAFAARRLPMAAHGRLKSGVFPLPGDVSSQFISGLLLALPGLCGDSEIHLNRPLESAGYVDMTLDALARFRVAAQRKPWGFAVPGGQAFRSPGTVCVAGDWSNAAFFLAAGVLNGPVTVAGLEARSIQGDRAIVTLLRRMGANIELAGDRVTAWPSTLGGCEMDMRHTPDLLPPLAVVAACATGESRFLGAARLRLKESDRLEATARLICGLGGAARVEGDILWVAGGGLRGGTAHSAGDHRMAMAAAIAATACAQPVTLSGAGAVAKSYPGFFEDYRRLQYVI